jgi:hypothetical protein
MNGEGSSVELRLVGIGMQASGAPLQGKWFEVHIPWLAEHLHQELDQGIRR